MYVVFFMTSNVWLKLKCNYAQQFKHAEQINGNEYMENFTLFKFSRTHAWKMTPLSGFREFAPPIEKYSFFAKMGKSVIYTLVGSRGPGQWYALYVFLYSY